MQKLDLLSCCGLIAFIVGCLVGSTANHVRKADASGTFFSISGQVDSIDNVRLYILKDPYTGNEYIVAIGPSGTGICPRTKKDSGSY